MVWPEDKELRRICADSGLDRWLAGLPVYPRDEVKKYHAALREQLGSCNRRQYNVQEDEDIREATEKVIAKRIQSAQASTGTPRITYEELVPQLEPEPEPDSEPEPKLRRTISKATFGELKAELWSRLSCARRRRASKRAWTVRKAGPGSMPEPEPEPTFATVKSKSTEDFRELRDHGPGKGDSLVPATPERNERP